MPTQSFGRFEKVLRIGEGRRLKRLAEQEGNGPERATKPLLEQPHELLVTLLVGITLINIGASALAAALAERLLGPVGLPIAIVAMVFLLSVFGEVLPMTVAVEHPEGFIGWVQRPVAWLGMAVAPIRVAVGAFTALSLRLVGSERKEETPEISEEELRTLVDVGAREGIVERTERDLKALLDRSRGIVLTDDYAPVENLLAPVARTRGAEE